MTIEYAKQCELIHNTIGPSMDFKRGILYALFDLCDSLGRIADAMEEAKK